MSIRQVARQWSLNPSPEVRILYAQFYLIFFLVTILLMLETNAQGMASVLEADKRIL
jgi:hypothetical protein